MYQQSTSAPSATGTAIRSAGWRATFARQPWLKLVNWRSSPEDRSNTNSSPGCMALEATNTAFPAVADADRAETDRGPGATQEDEPSLARSIAVVPRSSA